MLGKEHVGVEPAVRPPRRQHRPLVTDGRVVHDANSPRRRAADYLVGLGVPHHATYAGIGRCVHLCEQERPGVNNTKARALGCQQRRDTCPHLQERAYPTVSVPSCTPMYCCSTFY